MRAETPTSGGFEALLAEKIGVGRWAKSRAKIRKW